MSVKGKWREEIIYQWLITDFNSPTLLYCHTEIKNTYFGCCSCYFYQFHSWYFYNASKTLPSLHDLHFRDTKHLLFLEKPFTQVIVTFPAKISLRNSIQWSSLSPKLLRLQDQNYRQGHGRRLERKIKRKQEWLMNLINMSVLDDLKSLSQSK